MIIVKRIVLFIWILLFIYLFIIKIDVLKCTFFEHSGRQISPTLIESESTNIWDSKTLNPLLSNEWYYGLHFETDVTNMKDFNFSIEFDIIYSESDIKITSKHFSTINNDIIDTRETTWAAIGSNYSEFYFGIIKPKISHKISFHYSFQDSTLATKIKPHFVIAPRYIDIFYGEVSFYVFILLIFILFSIILIVVLKITKKSNHLILSKIVCFCSLFITFYHQ